MHDDSLLDEVLSRGGRVNTQSNDGQTPLSFAIKGGTCEAVEKLSSAGARIDVGDVLHRAVERENRTEGVGLLRDFIDRGAPLGAFEFASPEACVMRWAMRRGTALHRAAQLDHKDAVITLLNYGANPRSWSILGELFVSPTPLDVAASEEIKTILAQAVEKSPTAERH